MRIDPAGNIVGSVSTGFIADGEAFHLAAVDRFIDATLPLDLIDLLGSGP
jgi:hypothetical protein